MPAKKTTKKSSTKNKAKELLDLISTNQFITLMLIVSVMVLSFYSGSLYTKVLYLQGDLTGAPSAGGGNAVADAPELQPSTGPDADKLPEITQDDHIRGNPEANIYMVEYSDFECPFCARFHPTALQIMEEYGDDIAWVYRHFPLENLHPLAQSMAQASECAFDQGGNSAFWEFGDALFEQVPTSQDQYSDIASDLGLNVSEFESCLESGKFADKVSEQYQGGLSAGVNGTPATFILNLETGESQVLPGAVPFETAKQAIDSLL